MYVHIYLVKTLYVLHMDVIRTHIHVCIDDMYVHIYCYIAFIVVVIMGMRWGCVCCLATSKAGDREGEVLSLSLSLSFPQSVHTCSSYIDSFWRLLHHHQMLRQRTSSQQPQQLQMLLSATSFSPPLISSNRPNLSIIHGYDDLPRPATTSDRSERRLRKEITGAYFLIILLRIGLLLLTFLTRFSDNVVLGMQ